MQVKQACKRRRFQQRSIAVQNQQIARCSDDALARAQHRMPGPFLFSLSANRMPGTVHARRAPALPDAHHRNDLLRRSDLQRGPDHLVQQRVAARLVQNFGFVRFHACSQPGGQDHDRYVCSSFDVCRCALVPAVLLAL